MIVSVLVDRAARNLEATLERIPIPRNRLASGSDRVNPL